jgi:DNA/RNA-binding domain of Phe-tRNA-synthetase-like protein
MGAEEPLAGRGSVDPALNSELPGLRIRYRQVDRGSGRSPRPLKRRLRRLSDRFSGPQAIALRSKPIPWAYRVFYRHIGLDPDEQPTPVEEIAIERIKRGGFVSRSLLDDALTIATIETGVALRAFDADRVSGPPAIRPSGPGEALEGRPGALPAGTLIVADERRPLALLFGALASGRGVSRATRRTLLVAIGVRGVPEIAIEEAIWLVAEAMEA